MGRNCVTGEAKGRPTRRPANGAGAKVSQKTIAPLYVFCARQRDSLVRAGQKSAQVPAKAVQAAPLLPSYHLPGRIGTAAPPLFGGEESKWPGHFDARNRKC